MSTVSHFSDPLRQVLARSDRGIASLVDNLLAVGCEQGLCLEWHTDHCRVSSLEGDYEDLSELALGKTTFRAILARIAVLCIEQNGSSVSPYRGRGQLLIGDSPARKIQVSFTNTMDVQRLELAP